MLIWNKIAQSNGDHTWQIHAAGEHVADAGYSHRGRLVGGGIVETGLHYYFVASGRRIWFEDESDLKAFVDEVFQSQIELHLNHHHQAVLVGLMWAHEHAYTFDEGAPAPLPDEFPGKAHEVADRLLDRSPGHVRSSTPIVLVAARAAWNNLREQPIETRPFPILQ
jgi:hypothetical protein